MKLNWDTHVNVIGNKISRVIDILKKLQFIFPKEILLSIYNALILPHINYCLLSWGSGTLFCFVCQEYCPEYYRIIYLNR